MPKTNIDCLTDELTVIYSYFDIQSLNSLKSCSKTFYNSIEKCSHFYCSLLQYYCPNYFKCKKRKNLHCSCRYKLRSFLTSTSSNTTTKSLMYNARWENLGQSSVFSSRFLHRSVIVNNKNNIYGDQISYLIGGDNQLEILSDEVFVIKMNEGSGNVSLKKVTIQPGVKPGGISSTSLCCIPNGDIIMFGGLTNTVPILSNNLWRFKTINKENNKIIDDPGMELNEDEDIIGTWIKINHNNSNESVPSGRLGHNICNYQNLIFVFGGSSHGRVYNDLYICRINDTNIVTWHKVICKSNIPFERGGHSSCIINDYFYIYGGNTYLTSFADMWRINLKEISDNEIKYQELLKRKNNTVNNNDDTNIEEELYISGNWELIYNTDDADINAPSSRIGHSATAVGDYIFIFGGRDYIKREFSDNQIHFFNTITFKWNKLFIIPEILNYNDCLSSAFLPRTGHSAFQTSTGILFLGGLLPNGSSTSQLLHLNLFGVYTNQNLYENFKIKNIYKLNKSKIALQTVNNYVGDSYYDLDNIEDNNNNNNNIDIAILNNEDKIEKNNDNDDSDDDSDEGIKINIQNPNDVENIESCKTKFWNWFQNHLSLNNEQNENGEEFNSVICNSSDSDDDIKVNTYEKNDVSLHFVRPRLFFIK